MLAAVSALLATSFLTVAASAQSQSKRSRPQPFAEGPAGGPGTIQFDSPTYSINENGGTVTLDVTRTGDSSGSVSVSYTTSDGTATSGAGNDYTGQSDTLTWADGDTANQTIVIDFLDDATYEGDETFSVNLNTPTGGATLGSPDTTTVTITDNDAAPVFTINNVTQNETNVGSPTSFVFTVTKNGSTTLSSSVDYQTVNGTATAGSDYTAIPVMTLNFGPTDTTMQVTVLVNGDSGFEPNETFFVNLSGPANASISDSQGTGTINNDDAPTGPAITINDVAIAEGNSGSFLLTFTITLNRQSFSPAISVDFATADDSATVANNDYVANAGTLNFPAGAASGVTRFVNVTVNGDDDGEDNETFFVNLSNATAGTTIVDPQGLGTITNDDPFPAVLSITRSGNDIVITFEVIQGKSYRLERKLAMTDATWRSISVVADLTASATGPTQITDPGAISLGKAFYRVRLLP